MTITAVFPLELVKDSLKLQREGRYNIDLSFRFSRRKVAPVTCKNSPQWLHCGERPLVFITNVFVDGGSRLRQGRSVYIDQLGNHVYPG